MGAGERVAEDRGGGAVKIERIPSDDRAAWLANRKQDVTASEIAALFGSHPYRTAYQVFADKTGAGVDIGDNAAMRRGRILEPAVAEAWFEERGERLLKCHAYLRSPEHRIGATPDYARLCGEPVEMKTVAPEKWDEWKEAPPIAYQLQALVQAMLMDAPRAWIAVMVDNRAKDFRVFEVPRHPAAEAKIIANVAAFWRAVAAGEPPAPDYARDGAAIAAMFPRDNGEVLDLSADNRLPEMLARRAELKAQISAAEAEAEAIDAELKDKIGAASEATLPGWKITFKAQTRPERVVAASTFRVLRVTDTTKPKGRKAKELAL